MNELQFTNLLDRYEKGMCTAEEQQQLENWINSIKEGDSPFKSRIEKLRTQKTLQNAIYSKAGLPIAEARALTFIPVWMKVAASIALLVVAGYALWVTNVIEINNNTIAEAQATEQIEKLILDDGSIVWLKPGSKLEYPEKFDDDQRIVTLQGEALFEVAKDPQHPFIIHTGDLTTTVLGTSFNIKNVNGKTEVFVLTGKVSVASVQTQQKVELLPQERAVYAHATKQLQKDGTPVLDEPVQYTKGTEYNMAFNNMKVEEIAKYIEGKFNVTVTLKGKINACLITADFTDQSLMNTMDMISEALNASYNIDNKTVTLEGSGCE